jgi:hypothetical protein
VTALPVPVGVVVVVLVVVGLVVVALVVVVIVAGGAVVVDGRPRETVMRTAARDRTR